MAASPFTDLIRQYEEAKPHADPVTRDWFLVNNTPVYVWALTAVYLSIVLFGPTYMRHRKPCNVPLWFIATYNLGCVLLSMYMTVEIILVLIENKYDLMCAPYNEKSRTDPKEYRMKCVMYWYFFSKSVELMDTVLMVIRKKNGQITFLHVFHHASMLNIWWWVMMFIPAGASYFGALMNCLVHVAMYSYYGLSVFPSLRNKLWWKRYITMFQLVQFIVTGTHSTLNLYLECDFPVWGKYLLCGYMVILFTLFMNFYVNSYLSKRPKRVLAVGLAKPRENGAALKKLSETNGTVVGTSADAGEPNGHGPVANGASKKDL